MDPNANLKEMRVLVARILSPKRRDNYDGDRLAELVQALDEWIIKGGFLPNDWLPIDADHKKGD